MKQKLDERIIQLSEQELKDWFYHKTETLLEIEKKVLNHGVNKVLGILPEPKKEKLLWCSKSMMEDYPLVRNNDKSQPDHLIFLPEKYREQDYYDEIMWRFFGLLGKKYFKVFKNGIEEAISDISTQAEPYLEKSRIQFNQWLDETGKKLRKRVGRWELNPLEKSLIKNKNGKLEGQGPVEIKLQKAKISENEKDSVVKTINDFFDKRNEKISKQDLELYVQAYTDMKTNLQLIPHFIDKVYQKFYGNLIFLDRDARPLYESAKLFKKLKNHKNSLYLLPVTRNMIPNKYTEAHQNEKGALSSITMFLVNKRDTSSYYWEDGRNKELAKKEPLVKNLTERDTTLKLEDAIKTPEFKEKAEILYSYLKHVGALNSEQITAIDLGLLGTAVNYTCDVIKSYLPQKKTNPYLFFSGSSVDGFVRKELPHLGLNSADYIQSFESFPKQIPTVKEYEKQGDIWVPKYEKLTSEESKWITRKEGEVYLGVKLLEDAVKNLTIQYLQGK